MCDVYGYKSNFLVNDLRKCRIKIFFLGLPKPYWYRLWFKWFLFQFTWQTDCIEVNSLFWRLLWGVREMLFMAIWYAQFGVLGIFMQLKGRVAFVCRYASTSYNCNSSCIWLSKNEERLGLQLQLGIHSTVVLVIENQKEILYPL